MNASDAIQGATGEHDVEAGRPSPHEEAGQGTGGSRRLNVAEFLEKVHPVSYNAQLHLRDNEQWLIEIFGKWPGISRRGHDLSTEETWKSIRALVTALFLESDLPLPLDMAKLPSRIFPVEFTVWGRAAKVYVVERRHLIVEVAPVHHSRIQASQLVTALIMTYGGTAENVSESPTEDDPICIRGFCTKRFEQDPLHAIGFFADHPQPVYVHAGPQDTWIVRINLVPSYRTPEFRRTDKGMLFRAFLTHVLGITVPEEHMVWELEEPTETSPIEFILFARKAAAFVDRQGHWTIRLVRTLGCRTLEELVDCVGGNLIAG